MTVVVGAIRQVLATDPSQGIKAAAALREQMARDQITGAGPTEADLWFAPRTPSRYILTDVIAADEGTLIVGGASPSTARYLAAEASPRLAITGARRWTGVAERHTDGGFARAGTCTQCIDSVPWPCPDVTDALAEVDAWLSSLEVTDS